MGTGRGSTQAVQGIGCSFLKYAFREEINVIDGEDDFIIYLRSLDNQYTQICIVRFHEVHRAVSQDV